MSDVWRICVVMGEQALNQNLVNSLRKDGYSVNGAQGSADAMRMLWSEEYDIVICDLKQPNGDGFELLRWLRAYRSNVRAIVVGDGSKASDVDLRLQALESGATSYLEKPVDVRQIKDELRSLLQQTGFSASLDSFDLLDVIQIINMTRKSITLLVNTGLEEHGVLRFHNGDLAWAEYGILRGEEAFFALAAHKNGSVTQQITNDPPEINVTQPLSRLIFQALQYRTKYADKQQYSGEQSPVTSPSTMQPQGPAIEHISVGPYSDQDLDDSPFLFSDNQIISVQGQQIASGENMLPAFPVLQTEKAAQFESIAYGPPTEFSLLEKLSSASLSLPTSDGMQQIKNIAAGKGPLKRTDDLLVSVPSSGSRKDVDSRYLPIGKVYKPNPQESSGNALGETDFAPRLQPFAPEVEDRRAPFGQWPSKAQQRSSVPQSPRSINQSGIFEQPALGPHSRDASAKDSGQLQAESLLAASDKSARVERESSEAMLGSLSNSQRQVARKNALVSALQTLGYSIPGFIAAAVLDIESSLLAQVAIDDADLSQTWRLLSVMQRNVLDALRAGEWGDYEETTMTTMSHHILLRSIGVDKKAFLVLVTTREASYTDSLEVMANVEGAISAALR